MTLKPPPASEATESSPQITSGEASLRVTFLDGTTARLSYPSDLRILKDGVSLDTTGGEPGGQVRPQISYGGIYFRVREAPVRCLETGDGSLASVWRHPDGEVLIIRFKRWFVSVFETHTKLETWAAHLRGRVTKDGWLVLKGEIGV